MNNADNPAMPIVINEYNYETLKPVPLGTLSGLTKREYFAAMAIQGLCTHSGDYHTPENLASDAVMYADALLKELEKRS